MRRFRWRLAGLGWLVGIVLFSGIGDVAAQNPDSLSNYFEGKQVVVKIDMPGSQKGVDIYLDRPQPLDAKSYGDRLKDFGVSLQKGDATMITKVKVSNNNIEFQLGGGGFGTARDNSDTSVHFTPTPQSDREKELVDQLKTETDPDRRRSLQRELDYVRSERERKDAYEKAKAENDAARRSDQIASKRVQGGSRFNIRVDTRKMGDSLTPEFVEKALDQYVAFAGASGVAPVGGPAAGAGGQGDDPVKGLKKGMTREQVEALFGPATSANEHTENGMTITSCVYKRQDERVQADFVNGVLVRYQVSSN